jgi:hypothetical protein
MLTRQIPTLAWIIYADQWVGAAVRGDDRAAEYWAYRADKLVDDVSGIGQVERLRRQLNFPVTVPQRSSVA